MKKAVLFTLSALAVPAICFAAEPMKDGLWNISTTMEMPGMPMKMPPTTVQHCYSKAEVKDNSKIVNTKPDCSITEMKTSGNKLTWKMKCTGEHPGTFSGETVLKGDSYSSKMKMQTEGHVMNMKVDGKRVGPCP